MGVTFVRILLGLGGALLLFGGLVVLALGGAIFGLWMVIGGGVLLIAAALEVTRYRSEQAERRRLDPGPGGGEDTVRLEPRFRPTGELFVDPTSRARMRVYADPRTGERRYVAEEAAG